MSFEIQKAGLWQRASAFLFDSIITAILAVGFAALISLLTGYDAKCEALNGAYAVYEQRYGVDFGISEETYLSLPEEQKDLYDAAYGELVSDEETVKLYNLVVNLTLVSASLGILLSFLITEFTLPMVFGNGMTLGKKVFGLCVIHENGVKVDAGAMLVRTVLGKYTLETMVPVLTLVMLYFNFWGLEGTLLILGLLLVQVILCIASKYNCLLHDKLASTAVVDFKAQRIFESLDARTAFLAEQAAERAKRAAY